MKVSKYKSNFYLSAPPPTHVLPTEREGSGALPVRI
jgi:hypothetical protein